MEERFGIVQSAEWARPAPPATASNGATAHRKSSAQPDSTLGTEGLSSHAILSFFQVSQDYLCIVDTKGNLQQFNPAFVAAIGCPTAAILAKPFWHWLPPAEQPAARRIFEASDPHSSHHRWEGQLCSHSDQDQARWVEWTINRSPETDCFYCIGRDITERQRHQLDLQRAQETLDGILNSEIAAIISFRIFDNYDGEWLYFSQGCTALFGYSTPELMADKNLWAARVHPDDFTSTILPLYKNIFAGQSVPYYEYRFAHKDGEWRWVAVNLVVKPDELGRSWICTTVATDITATKNAEAALKESHARFQDLVLTSSNVVWECDATLKLTHISGPIFQILGYTTAELIGKTPYDLIPQDELLERHHQIQTTVAARAPYQFLELRYLTKSGAVAWVEMSGVPILDHKDEFCGYRGTLRDISERKHTEKALRESEEKFRHLAEHANLVLWIADLNHRLIYASPAYAKIWGVSGDCAYLKPNACTYAIHPEDQAQATQAFQDLVESGTCYNLVYRIIRPDGTVRWLRDRGFPLFNDEGVRYRSAGVVEDITEQKQAAFWARQAEAERQAIFNSFPDLFFRIDAQGTVLDYNAGRGAQAIHTDSDTILGVNFFSLFAVDPLTEREQSVKAALSTQTIISREYSLSDAFAETHYEARFAPISADQAVVTLRNINEQKQAQYLAQQRLFEAEEWRGRYEAAGRACDQMLYDFDIQKGTATWGMNAAQVLGYKPDAFPHNLGEWLVLIHPEDVPRAQSIIEQALAQKSLLGSLEYRIRRQDGEYIWIRDSFALKLENDRYLKRIIGFVTDIDTQKKAAQALTQINETLERKVQERTEALATSNASLQAEIEERLQAETALQQAKDQLKAVFDAVPGHVTWVNANLQYLGLNGHMAEDFNLIPAEFIGKSVLCLRDRMPDLTDFICSFFESENQVDLLKTTEIKHLINGLPKTYLIIAKRYAQGEAGVFVAVDITEQKMAESEIQKALAQEQRLNEFKSRFIATVSHEFRTPLSSILSASELLEHYSHKWTAEKKIKFLHQIQASVGQMKTLLEDVLTISSSDADKLALNPAPLDLVQFCQQLIEQISLGDHSRCDIQFKTTHSHWPTILDEKHIRQILGNLLSNAIKYSPEGGEVVLDLILQPHQATFTIQDKGIGIPADDLGHLFDSFHRGQNVGTIQGTGLGLGIVKRSIDLHQGSINVISAVGTGTEVKVVIPLPIMATLPLNL